MSTQYLIVKLKVKSAENFEKIFSRLNSYWKYLQQINNVGRPIPNNVVGIGKFDTCHADRFTILQLTPMDIVKKNRSSVSLSVFCKFSRSAESTIRFDRDLYNTKINMAVLRINLLIKKKSWEYFQYCNN